jgi:hypothetical protein
MERTRQERVLNRCARLPCAPALRVLSWDGKLLTAELVSTRLMAPFSHIWPNQTLADPSPPVLWCQQTFVHSDTPSMHRVLYCHPQTSCLWRKSTVETKGALLAAAYPCPQVIPFALDTDRYGSRSSQISARSCWHHHVGITT